MLRRRGAGNQLPSQIVRWSPDSGISSDNNEASVRVYVSTCVVWLLTVYLQLCILRPVEKGNTALEIRGDEAKGSRCSKRRQVFAAEQMGMQDYLLLDFPEYPANDRYDSLVEDQVRSEVNVKDMQ